MLGVGSTLQCLGGSIGRLAVSGLLLGIFLVVVGVTPSQFFANLIQHSPAVVGSVWFSPSIAIVGLALIFVSLRYNLWSKRQLHVFRNL
jgi:hypothetical protein